MGKVQHRIKLILLLFYNKKSVEVHIESEAVEILFTFKINNGYEVNEVCTVV